MDAFVSASMSFHAGGLGGAGSCVLGYVLSSIGKIGDAVNCVVGMVDDVMEQAKTICREVTKFLGGVRQA